jgi:hypothetical protein
MLTKTYGFNASTKIYYKRGWSIRAQLTLIAQPANLEDRAALFPNNSLEEFRQQTVSYVLKKRRLAATISLLPALPWRVMSTGRPGLFIEELPFLVIDQTLWIDLRIWIVFHGPPPAPVRDAKEWGAENVRPRWTIRVESTETLRTEEKTGGQESNTQQFSKHLGIAHSY